MDLICICSSLFFMVLHLVHVRLVQMLVSASMQAATAAGAPALAALLSAAPGGQLEERSMTARALLYIFLLPFELQDQLQQRENAQQTPSGARLISEIWQRAAENPLALAAAVEAIQACYRAPMQWSCDVMVVSAALWVHLRHIRTCSAADPHLAGWLDLLGSERLQQFAMDALEMPEPSETPNVREPLIMFFAEAAKVGKLSEARMSTLLTHEQVLASLMAAAEGREGLTQSAVYLLIPLWRYFDEKKRRPDGSPEAHLAAQSAIMAALRQGSVLMQLKAVAAPQKRRAVQRARKNGFLQVCLSSAVPSAIICHYFSPGDLDMHKHVFLGKETIKLPCVQGLSGI
jgi:hypothetical protein